MLGINWTADFGRPLSTAELRTDESSTQQAVLHGSHNSHVLGNLDVQKQ